MTRPRILVVDDDPGMVRLLGTTLGGEGRFDLFEARDGETAVSMAQREHPDLIVLDVFLPGLNGFEVCSAIKRDPQTQNARVVLLTVLGDSEEHLSAAQTAGADAYLTKPFSPLALLETVHRLLP